MRIFEFFAAQISNKFLFFLNFLFSQATVADLTVVARVKAGYPDLEVHDVENFIQTQKFVFLPLPLFSVFLPLSLSLYPLSLSLSLPLSIYIYTYLSLTLSLSLSLSVCLSLSLT